MLRPRHLRVHLLTALPIILILPVLSPLTGCGDDEADVPPPDQIQEASGVESEPERARVPNVEELRLLAARRALQRAGLELKLFREHHPELEEGFVISQDPERGERVVPGSPVLVTVSKGKKPTPEPTGPYGALGTSSIGPVKVGMDESQVEALFGAPHRTEEVNFGGGPTPQVDWIWDLGGEVRVKFDTAGGVVTGYSVDSASLATASGYSVGDSFAPIEEEYGGQLTPYPIGGPGSWVLSEGEPGTYPALVFFASDGVISSISGGEPQAAGE